MRAVLPKGARPSRVTAGPAWRYPVAIMRRSLLFALFPLTAAAQAALAQEPLYKPLPGVDYYCSDQDGARVEIGQVMCFTASCQTWMARCEMSRNNNVTMWRKLQDGCPGVSLPERIERLKPGVDAGTVHAQI